MFEFLVVEREREVNEREGGMGDGRTRNEWEGRRGNDWERRRRNEWERRSGEIGKELEK